MNRELDVVMKRLTSDHSPTTKLTRLPKRDDLLFRVRVLWLLHDGRPMRARELVVQRVHLGSGAREKRPLSAPQKKPATKWKEPIKSEPKVRATGQLVQLGSPVSSVDYHGGRGFDADENARVRKKQKEAKAGSSEK